MYNPIKQSQDHDPDGVFIRKWVPELRNMPDECIHEPWNMSDLEKQSRGIIYPDPIIDLVSSAKKARDKIWGHRKNDQVQSEKKRIVRTHVRKKSSGNKKRNKTSQPKSAQLAIDLFPGEKSGKTPGNK